MDRASFLNAIIDDGIEDIRLNYQRPDQAMKKEGGIAGFSECRGLSDEDLLKLFERAKARRIAAQNSQDHDYWRHRMYELQVEWVLNVLSAAAYNQGLKMLVPPTVRGMTKAGDILGFSS